MASKQEVFESKMNMINALSALKSAWFQCEKSFSDSNINCNDFIVENFPFQESFDDINVFEWVNSSIDKLQKSL
jgi:hypothetical protein